MTMRVSRRAAGQIQAAIREGLSVGLWVTPETAFCYVVSAPRRDGAAKQLAAVDRPQPADIPALVDEVMVQVREAKGWE